MRWATGGKPNTPSSTSKTTQATVRCFRATSLAAWCGNLVENWDACVADVGEGKARVWGLYMAGSRLGFEMNVVQLHQVLAVKLAADGDDGGLPLRPWWEP